MILDQQKATIGIAIATLVMPAVFVAVAAAAWWRRNRGGKLERTSINELVEWMAGGEADIVDLEAAVEALGPRDSDVRLRGEVALAAARTRRLVADPAAGDPLAPLLEVRERLGRRADGQVARALRRRLIPVFLVFGIAFGLLSTVVTAGSMP